MYLVQSPKDMFPNACSRDPWHLKQWNDAKYCQGIKPYKQCTAMAQFHLLTWRWSVYMRLSLLWAPCWAFCRKAMLHLANVSFQDWSMFWNMESASQLDIGVQADFGYPSNSHVMIPKQLRCWKAVDTWGKWLWKTETVFQPYSHIVVRSAYWHVFNSSSFSAWPTDYQISDQTFYFPVFPYEIQTPAKEEPAWEEYKGWASWPCPALCCHGTVPLRCAACSQPLTAHSCFMRLKELQNTSWDCKIG